MSTLSLSAVLDSFKLTLDLSSRRYDNYDEGYRFGKLALALQSRFPVSAWLPRVSLIFHGCIFGCKQPFQKCVGPLDDARKLALRLGDTESAVTCATAHFLTQLDLVPVPDLLHLIQSYRKTALQYGQELNLFTSQPSLVLLLGLSSRNDGYFGVLRNETLSEEELRKLKTKHEPVFLWAQYCRMVLCYLLGNYEKAAFYADECRALVDVPNGLGDCAVVLFFDGLVSIAMSRKCAGLKKTMLLCRARKRLKRIRLLAKHAPFNHLGKVYLLQAELAVSAGSFHEAYPKYTSAVSLARDGGFYVLTALAMERQAKFLNSCMLQTELSLRCMEEAIAVYQSYGADLKVAQMLHDVERMKKSSPPSHANDHPTDSTLWVVGGGHTKNIPRSYNQLATATI